MTGQIKPKVAPHPFVVDADLPPDLNGRHVCVCGLVGAPGDAHHAVAGADGQQAHRRRYGDAE